MSKRKPTVGTSVSDEEYALLEAEAERQGVSLSTLIYRRVMNDPTAVRRPGRPTTRNRPAQTQPEELFAAS